MAPIYSVPASTSLVAEINELSARSGAGPRDKSSDGTIGDLAHSQSSSDHNLDESGRTPYEDSDSLDEVHARDVDETGPWPSGWSMYRITRTIAERHRQGLDNRLQNIIFNGKINSRSWGWDEWRPYYGANKHDKHAHFSFRYGSGSGQDNPENVTKPWGLLAAWAAEQEDDMPTAKEIATEVWTTPGIQNMLARVEALTTGRDTVPLTGEPVGIVRRLAALEKAIIALGTAVDGVDNAVVAELQDELQAIRDEVASLKEPTEPEDLAGNAPE